MKTKLSMLAVLAAISAPAAAGTIDLGVASNYNVFVLDNYQTSQWGWSSIGGALAVGGNANLTSTGVSNSKNNQYKVVVGGAATVNSWDSTVYNNAAGINFAAAKSNLSGLSNSLNTATTTGSVEYKYGTGGYLTGTNSNVEYFTLNAANLSSIDNWHLSNIASGATLIVNVYGSNVALTGGWDAFSGYNTLFNFYDAKTISLNNINFSANILATEATITGSSGSVNGTVIANNWNNSLTLGTGNGFVAITTAVPEPSSYALLLAGLGVMGLTATRRKRILAGK